MSDHPRNRPGHLHAVNEPPTDGTAPPPNDQDAEKAVLGAMLTNTRACDDVTLTLPNGQAFYQPRHELIYDALVHQYARGYPCDVIAIGDHLDANQTLTRAGGRAYLAELTLHPGAAIPASAGYYADIVNRHHHARQVDTLGTALRALAQSPDFDTARAYAHVTDRIAALQNGAPAAATPGLDIDEFLAGEDDPYDWLIPGVIERQDRLILTAGEGKGKSTLCRQLGIQAAAGIHPFTGEIVPPVKVLILDLENTKRQSRRKLRPLRLAAGEQLDPARLVIECRTAGIDLTQASDRAWLANLVAHHHPDLLITGPIYKMASGDTDKEKDSKPVAMALDTLREAHDMAVILEAHTRKAEGNNPKHRPKEPFGWSGWMRWPEFGLHLSDDGEITHWRGARDERDFPHQLNRGGRWPWTASLTINNQNWVKVRSAIREAGQRLTLRQLEDATGLSKSTVQRVQSEHGVDLANLYYELGMDES